MSKIDPIDKRLVRLLEQDAQQSSETLAKQLNLSAATVRRRLRKLIRSDLLRIIGVVDPANFGFPLIAVITLDVSHDKVELAMEELSKQPEDFRRKAIVHELLHMRYPNHGKMFNLLLTSYSEKK